jgi:hypothetical protein
MVFNTFGMNNDDHSPANAKNYQILGCYSLPKSGKIALQVVGLYFCAKSFVFPIHHRPDTAA